MIIILITQVLTMFLLAAIGMVMFKSDKITLSGSKSLANILLYLALPSVIIQGFLVERDEPHVQMLLLSVVAAVAMMVVSILVSRLLFAKDPTAHFASAFANPGFFGIPVITAILSPSAVFFVAHLVAILNLFQWTYGVGLWKKEKSSFLAIGKRLLSAPFMIAILLGLFFFFTGFEMHELMHKCITFLAGLNTPLAMFAVGVYMAQTNLKAMFTKPILYKVSFARLLLIPLISLGILSLFPSSMSQMKLAFLIAAACPTGSNIAMYAQLYDQDYPYAVETVVISTLFCIVTMPLVILLAQSIWI